ncbi:ATP-binding protein [Aureibacter tunicatorum]|uniref:histidine kinase n=1 Tax=Aureibacter tunicatorum TaxID=866807 RepID=A0AAE4BU95_9BACT|nr:ATP-binding protein [Aureibacter tunicatorum]MDR6240538.1 signal transduction histidine kinase/DNA-binding response OmpR family regulator [Aureibacter tunicatorum]
MRLTILLLAFALYSNTGCLANGKITTTLDEIKKTYSSHPDSSIGVINELLLGKTVSINHKRRAFYLKAKCFEKKYLLDSAEFYFNSILSIEPKEEMKYDVLSLYRLGVISSMSGDLENELKFFNKALALLPQVPDEIRTHLLVYNALGNGYTNLDLYDSALFYLKKGEGLASQHPNQLEMQWNLSYASVNALKSSLRYHEAVDLSLKSLEIANKMQDTVSIAKSYIAIGVLFLDLKEIEKSLNKLEFARQILINKGEDYWTAIANYNLAIASLLNEDYDSALSYAEACYQISISQGHKRYQSNFAALISSIYYKMESIDDMLPFAQLGYEIASENSYDEFRFRNGIELIKYYWAKEKYETAYDLIRENEPIFEKRDNDLYKLEYLDLKSKVLYELRLFEEAFNTVDLKSQVKDLIYGAENDLKGKYFENKQKHENEKKEILEKQKLEELILQQEIKRQKWFIVLVVLLLVLFGAFAVIYYRYYKLKSKDNALLMKVNEKIKMQNETLEANNKLIAQQALELQKMDEYKSRFFRNISHEFRTPLTLILGPIKEVIQEKRFDLEYFKSIESNAVKLLSLINQILELSQLQSSKKSLELATLDLPRFVKLLIDQFHSYANEKKTEIIFECNLKNDVFVSEDIVNKVLSNLISNALKHTPEGGCIYIDAKEFDQKLIITVSDTGAGIPESEIDNVFRPFYTSDDDAMVSSGIGLALVKEMVEDHQGSIQVGSLEDMGAVFIVELPMKKEFYEINEIDFNEVDSPQYGSEDIELINKSISSSTDDSIFNSEDKKRILVVEDNDELRKYIGKILSGLYNVEFAENGEEGIKKAEDLVPDLVITDLMMPVKNGMDLLMSVKKNILTSHIPVILLTAKSDKQTEMESLESYADDFLTKPFDKEVLLLKVRNLLELRERIKANYGQSEATDENDKEVQRSFKNEQSEFCRKAIEIIRMNMANSDFSVEKLAADLSISRSQLHRKLSAETGLSSSIFIRNVKLVEARELLELGDKNVSEVSYLTGFSTPNYFSKCFKEYFGTSPSSFVKKFNVDPESKP